MATDQFGLGRRALLDSAGYRASDGAVRRIPTPCHRSLNARKRSRGRRNCPARTYSERYLGSRSGGSTASGRAYLTYRIHGSAYLRVDRGRCHMVSEPLSLVPVVMLLLSLGAAIIIFPTRPEQTRLRTTVNLTL